MVISIHALLAESDAKLEGINNTLNNFYPRSPCGERRRQTYQLSAKQEFLSTLSLRRATLIAVRISLPEVISIHALLAESDLGNVAVGLHMSNFYPRSPCGERLHCKTPITFRHYFYPRSPCGERRVFILYPDSAPTFLSTLSLRRATGGKLL